MILQKRAPMQAHLACSMQSISFPYDFIYEKAQIETREREKRGKQGRKRVPAGLRSRL